MIKKIHIHRLLMMYKLQSDINENLYVHHKDGNKLNAQLYNLELIDSKKHQSIHNKNKKLSAKHRRKISEANKKRKGIKIKKTSRYASFTRVYKTRIINKQNF